MKVAVCQYATVLGDKARNIELSLEWLARAGQANVDLVALPELITTGYNAGEAMLDLAEPVPGPTTALWGEAARRYGYYVVAGLCRRDDALPSVIYNSAVLISPRGEVEGVYSKVVLPLYLHSWLDERGEPVVWEEAEIFRPGDALPVFKTDWGTLGIQICQDAVYPEFTRAQAMQGAELIVQLYNGIAVPTQHEADITPLTSRVHAYDNGVYIVAANKCGVESLLHGGRAIPFTFRGESHIADPNGNFVARAAPEQEELLVAEIDLAQVRKAQWRQKFYRDWRPELLEPLFSKKRNGR